jgi:ligand-binding sensor domain-containing protein/two-component sensor histidine kinase
MRKIIILILSLCVHNVAKSQQGFAFNRLTTDDGIGLASNKVMALHQDERGFIWVGTANGLQRFDGSKFITFSVDKNNSDPLPHVELNQILPIGDGSLLLSFVSIREFGIFNPSTFIYKKISIKTNRLIQPRAEFELWKSADGNIYLNVFRFGILAFNKQDYSFIDNNRFKIPPSWIYGLNCSFEDVIKQQIWFGCDSGFLIYDKRTKQIWNRHYNPMKIPILDNKRIQEKVTEFYIDSKRRYWVFGWPVWGGGGQYKFCLDSTGKNYVQKDTVGLNQGPIGYTEYHAIYETSKKDMWIYGNGVLFNYDKNANRFFFNKGNGIDNNTVLQYDIVNQVIEDKDGSIWIATDRGLYFTSYGSGTFSVVNITFNQNVETTNITDILELPNGDFWFTSWGNGIRSIDRYFRKIPNNVYNNPPPSNWPLAAKNAIRLTWAMCRESATGKIWIGCNGGILLVFDPITNKTEYLQPQEFNSSTVRYITEDKYGHLWFSTQGGRLIKYNKQSFTVVQDVGTIIYKAFIDKQGLIWLAAHEKGLFEVDPISGKILKHFTAGKHANALYSNTGEDIEQLNDSIIVFGAMALNFINKRTNKVSVLSYEDGLPSNSVRRVRMDNNGFLWIITASGLCRYNPQNHRITPYGRKDGIVLAEQTKDADFNCTQNYIMFGGGNAIVMFKPEIFLNSKPPTDVAITDFRLFNNYLPVDSLLSQQKGIVLKSDQNTFSIYFSSLSYVQRDKLTYYYKMEGINKNWIKADRSFSVSYSLLPPGKYIFQVYCENIEGIRSGKTTLIEIYIRPPFWRTWWFLSTLLFIVALIIYAVHNMRVNKLLAVEKIRNRVARDLHDDMGSTLSTINILSAMAKSKIATDAVKTTEYLGKISDNSQRMMEAMDDIVWSIKPSNDSMQKITARMREFATNVLEAKEISLDFKVDESVFEVKLDMEARRDFFLIFKEAVNNAAKYSKSTLVEVNVTVVQKSLQLIVKDNGLGFDAKHMNEGNGMGNMQKRADNLKGELRIQSSLGKGTEVKLTVVVS